MSGIRDGDCLCNRPAGVTFVVVQGQRVGLSGTEELFKAWLQAGREPSGLSAGEVLTGVRKRNYVSAPVEDAYVEAVRSAYGRWCARAARPAQSKADAQG
jgi:hypothetical protein